MLPTQIGALAALGDLGEACPPSTREWLVPFLRADDPDLRDRALRSLHALGIGFSYAIPEVIAAMLDRGGRLSILDCERYITRVEPLSIRVIPEMIAALRHSSPTVRLAAICQLARLQNRAGAALGELESLAASQDVDPRERTAILQAIEQIKSAQVALVKSQPKQPSFEELAEHCLNLASSKPLQPEETRAYSSILMLKSCIPGSLAFLAIYVLTGLISFLGLFVGFILCFTTSFLLGFGVMVIFAVILAPLLLAQETLTLGKDARGDILVQSFAVAFYQHVHRKFESSTGFAFVISHPSESDVAAFKVFLKENKTYEIIAKMAASTPLDLVPVALGIGDRNGKSEYVTLVECDYWINVKKVFTEHQDKLALPLITSKK